jgi:mxaA protein
MSLARSPVLRALILAGLLVRAAAAAAEVGAVILEGPRDFGYVIGDVIRLRAEVKLDGASHLDADALPKPGPVNRWLQLRRIEHSFQADGLVQTLRLSFEYQTFQAPLAPRRLTIPAVALVFRGDSGRVEAAVPPWSFTMTPLHEARADQAMSAESLKADARTLIPEPWGDWAALAAGLSLGGLSLVYMAYLKGLMPYWSKGRHFARALSELARLEEGEQLAPAYRLVHGAFNRTLGRSLFAEDLERFFAGHPQYLPVRSEIEGFFRASYELFFADNSTGCGGEEIQRLQALCRQCLRIERHRS